MLVRFAHPRKLNLGKKESKLYPKGVHEVPDHLKEDWFFKAQVKEGHLAIMPKEEPAAEEAPAKPQPRGK